MKFFLMGFLLAFASMVQAQEGDSLLFFTKGDITKQIFSVEEILIGQTCDCVGACKCSNKTEEAYADDRFISTEKILSRSGRIDLVKRGNFAFEPILNGMGSERINLTIDGMKIFGACTDKMDPVTSYVETNNLKNFTISNGAAGSKQGASIAGSIDMETTGAKFSSSTAWTGEVGSGYNSTSDGLNGLVSLNRSSKKFAFNANGVYRKNNSYKSGGGAVVPFSYFEKWNAAFSGKYMATERDLISFDVIIDEGHNIGYPALPMDVEFAKAHIYGLTYKHYPKAQSIDQLTFKAYANNVSHSMDDTQRPNVFMHMDMPGWTKTYGAFADIEMTLKTHKINAKIDGYHSNSLAEMTMYPNDEAPMFMLTWPDVDKLDFGAFIQDAIQISNKNLIQLNARIDYLLNTVRSQFGIDQASVLNQDLSGNDIRIIKSASATFQRTFSKQIKAWITGGYAERAPSVTEQYAFYIFNAYDGYDYIGKVDLNSEKALQADVGLTYNPSEKLAFTVSGFNYLITDYIIGKIKPELDAMTNNSAGVKASENINQARISGGSLAFSYNPAEKIEFSSQFSYVYGKTYSGSPLPLIPPLKNTTSIRFSFTKPAFISFQLETAAKQNRLNPDFGESATPAFTIFHLRGGYTFNFKETRLSANAGMENIFDTEYSAHLDWGGIPRPGRNIYFNLTFGF